MKLLITMLALVSLSAFAEPKERHELTVKKPYSSPYFQDGKILSEESELKPHSQYCQIVGVESDPDEVKNRVLLGEALVHPQGDGTYMIHFLKEGYAGKSLRFYCLLNTEDNLLQNIASQLGSHADFIRSQFIDDEDLDDKDLASACEKKVIGHYSGIYHRTYKAANNTFLNNFIGRKNMWGHTFGAPKIAFENLMLVGENYLAQGIVEKSKKSGNEVYLKYMRLLRTEKLCKDMGDNYKKPRKLRKYLLQNLKVK